MKIEAGVVIRMEFQGQQDLGVFAWKVTSGLKKGLGFHGKQDVQWVWLEV